MTEEKIWNKLIDHARVINYISNEVYENGRNLKAIAIIGFIVLFFLAWVICWVISDLTTRFDRKFPRIPVKKRYRLTVIHERTRRSENFIIEVEEK